MKRIGLFGGSFNPVHIGHLLVAQAALEEWELDRIFFIPAQQSPFKPDAELAPASERLRLLRLALAGSPQSEVDDQEIRRGGVSYTIDTARQFRRRYPGAEMFYLIGSDLAAQLPLWREAQALAELVEMIIVPRPGEPARPAPAPFRSRLLAGFPLALSASQIRERIKSGRSIRWLTPPAVAEAIVKNGLYL